MRTDLVLALIVGFFVVVPPSREAAAQAPGATSELRVQPLESPAAAGTGQPQLTVSNRGVLLSWIARDGDRASLKFAEHVPGGWSAARTVTSGEDWFVNWADVPSVLRMADGTIAAHWLQKSGPGTYAYDLRLSYSKNDGQTWSPSFTPHDDGTKTEHGFASLFEVPGSGLGLIWLDGRSMTSGSHEGAASMAQGAMSLRSGTFDSRWKQTSQGLIDPRVCDCCPTSAAVTADGVIAAFRNRTDDEVRDIYVSRFEKGQWTEPKPVYQDGWHITSCPVNGPMLSARGRQVVLAWFTGKDDPGHSFVAFSKDAGRTFSSPVRLDEHGSLGRVDVELLPDGSAVASWLELVEKRAEFRIRRIESSGVRSAPVTIANLPATRTTGYPRIAWHRDELVAAWVESVANQPGASANARVRTATVRAPSALAR